MAPGSTPAQRELADYCEWLPDGERRPCYAGAAFVLIRPGGDRVLERDRWEAAGGGYRGRMLGG